MAGPLILSVIIPVRNQARPLARLLANLKRQPAPSGWEVEIIVADNGSTGDTVRVIRDSGFRSVLCETLGASSARNAGVRASRGQMLYFIDADACPVHDDHFLRIVDIAARTRQVGAFGGPVLLPRRQRWNPIAIGDHWACWFNWHVKRAPQRTTLFQPSLSLVVSRAAFEAINGFDPAVRILEDMEFQSRLMRAGYPLFFAPRLPVTHEARGSFIGSLRHSWSWGAPFRARYLAQTQDYRLKYPLGNPKFAWNLPSLYARRMNRVSRQVWMNSKWQACFCYPFLALTVFSWALGVVWGRDEAQESLHRPAESTPRP